ncbi:MAG: hypothetical protein IT427_16250 [Pirellulales bacterium]|nr:hypothetical protein [Pirellulales bacterium]
MTDKKQTILTPSKPVHTIRCQDIVAFVHRRQSLNGFTYFDYTLARNWSSMSTNKLSSGCTFFPANEEALVETIHQVTAWIRANLQSPGTNTSTAGTKDNGQGANPSDHDI